MTSVFVGEQIYLNYINGEWCPASAGQTVPSINPAKKTEVVGYVQSSSLEDLNHAVASARKAQNSWRKLSGAARGDYLFKAANAIERRIDEIAETMTREMGKTLPEAKGETARGVAILRYYAGEGMRKIGEVIPSTDSEALMFTTRVPLGVVGVISPWNFPVAIPIWKIAPALIYGNSVVLKPALETAVTAAKVMECFAEAGLPAGVLNMVTGSGSIIGQGLAEHPEVNGITFTGSNQVGKRVAQAALARGAKYQLEMGGKNPILIAADADLDLAVDATISGGIRSTGQKCTATSRVIVMRDVYETFKEKLLSKIKGLTVGYGLDAGTWLGPCANENQLRTVQSYIQKGIEEGAELLFGGASPVHPDLAEGFYIQPTVFGNVTPAMAIAREEIFGPVLALIQVESMEEAIRVANDSEFGLCASIYTNNISNILSFVQDMDAGLVRVNSETAGVELQAPFGGMKQSSSHSREQGQAAIEFYTSIKTVFIKA
ncbi:MULTISPECIES: alpha-ketoglutaric semialdehyde dehydrogenase GucD [unclassified Paenibacillus]|uniref:alpha-ketoglutaric semialdehyde dehydrogenase GucD n=1 Tax=unclassified Paenibacillus TaxID=185978 RepID=UPI0006FFBFDC|nr:alpha-ketoglutaric semialdehyde dehydrogenase GucD [Paenibacillus sp. Soil750]KRE60274.1 aldehyde dehydrogenase [Paenibacillus sp. Soil750]